ncbi:MAG: 16S rRNA (cytosine(967)-C(5))-methyltransferase RsmB [Clostridia bacterium]|nr:16S rRNA (cytosine(967)-C(5))-methyltransferase RsmB [Clostridia bacterium]
MNIREIALSLLEGYEAGGKYVNLALSSHITDSLTTSESSALTALLYTTVEQKLRYDYYIAALSGRSISDINLTTRNILRLGLCQILDMHSIPDFAAVNETVKLAKGRGERSFVNGVLRAAVRKKDDMPMPPKEKNYRRYLSVKHSFPLWIVKLLSDVVGEEELDALLHFYNTSKYTDITVNRIKTTPEEVKDELLSHGLDVYIHIDTGLTLRTDRSFNPENIDGFRNGRFFIQDTASAIAARVLSPSPSDVLVDVCSAPGGKSFAAAILMGDCGEIHSFDLHESKLSLIEGGRDRLGLKSLTVSCRDALNPDTALFGRADKVICDVPCSGLGVLSKKPDLRYKSEELIAELPALQLKILTESAKYLKDGGVLLYSTCTLNPKENEEVVRAFLEENGDFYAVDFEVGGLSSKNGRLTLIPHIHKTDGFFMAKLKRK